MKTKDKIQVGTLFRAMPLSNIDEEKRTAEISFSSELPVERFFGDEILDHAVDSVRLEWLNSGRAPLLADHNNSVHDQIGVIEKAEIGGDKKGRAVVRFGKGALAEELFNNVKDGIMSAVSVGYRIHKMVLQSSEDAKDVFRITDWEPLEVSLVSVPADKDVGFGRDAQTGGKWDVDVKRNETPLKPNLESTDMKTKNQPLRAPENEGGAAAATGISEADVKARSAIAVKNRDAEVARIIEIGKKFNQGDAATAAIRDGQTSDSFLDFALSNSDEAEAVRSTGEIGLTKKEGEGFSFLRAMNAVDSGNWTGAEFEKEVCEATQKLNKSRKYDGLAIPMDVMLSGNERTATKMMQRDLSAGVLDSGGYLVGTTHASGSFIELLRAQLLLSKLGVRILSGLVGNVAIPKLTGGATAYWVNEGSDVTESTPGTGSVTLTPKTVAGHVDVTRKLLKQSSPDVESLIREDLALSIALKIEAAAYNGTGASGEPLGILNTTGIGSETLGTPATFGDYVNMETEVATDNALFGSLNYVMTHALAGDAKQNLKASAVSGFIWDKNEVNGHPAYRTSQMPTGKAIFGNFRDAIIGEWGSLDLTLDKSNQNKSGGMEIVAMQDIDFAVRHAESFCAGV